MMQKEKFTPRINNDAAPKETRLISGGGMAFKNFYQPDPQDRIPVDVHFSEMFSAYENESWFSSRSDIAYDITWPEGNSFGDYSLHGHLVPVQQEATATESCQSSTEYCLGTIQLKEPVVVTVQNIKFPKGNVVRKPLTITELFVHTRKSASKDKAPIITVSVQHPDLLLQISANETCLDKDTQQLVQNLAAKYWQRRSP